MKRGIAVGLAVAVAAALLAAELSAHGLHVPTDITVHNETATVYEGVVGSPYVYCVPGRTVIVVDDENTNGIDRYDTRIGIARTAQNGAYKIAGDQVPKGDLIVARVKKKKLTDGTVCATAQDVNPALEA